MDKKIKKIDIINFAMNPLPPQWKTEGKKLVFGFEVNVQQRYDITTSNTYVMVGVGILDNDTKGLPGQITLGMVSCILTFEMSSLKDFLDNNGNVQLPSTDLLELNSLALDTLRGIMFAKFTGTYLHNAILPIIDSSQFVYEPIK